MEENIGIYKNQACFPDYYYLIVPEMEKEDMLNQLKRMNISFCNHPDPRENATIPFELSHVEGTHFIANNRLIDYPPLQSEKEIRRMYQIPPEKEIREYLFDFLHIMYQMHENEAIKFVTSRSKINKIEVPLLSLLNPTVKSENVCFHAVCHDIRNFLEVPPNKGSERILKQVIGRHGDYLEHLQPFVNHNEYDVDINEIYRIGLKNSPTALKYIPPGQRTPELCKIAANGDLFALGDVPKKFLNQEFLSEAIEKNKDKIHRFHPFCIPSEFPETRKQVKQIAEQNMKTARMYLEVGEIPESYLFLPEEYRTKETTYGHVFEHPKDFNLLNDAEKTATLCFLVERSIHPSLRGILEIPPVVKYGNNIYTFHRYVDGIFPHLDTKDVFDLYENKPVTTQFEYDFENGNKHLVNAELKWDDRQKRLNFDLQETFPLSQAPSATKNQKQKAAIKPKVRLSPKNTGKIRTNSGKSRKL